jgi:hypothetical protein
MQRHGMQQKSKNTVGNGTGVIRFSFTNPQDLRSTTKVSVPSLSSDRRRVHQRDVTINTPRVETPSGDVSPLSAPPPDVSCPWELDADGLFEDDMEIDSFETAAPESSSTPQAPRYFSAVCHELWR